MPAVVSVAVAGGVAHRLGHAEVHDQGVPAGEHHVVGLDVAVHDAVPVRVGERVGDLAEDPHRLVRAADAPVAGRAGRAGTRPRTNGMT